MAFHNEPISLEASPSRFSRGFHNWFAVLSALVLRDIWRHGRNRWTLFTFFLLVVEPVGVVAAFGLISMLLMRAPPYGPSIFLFHATGIVPYYYFVRVSAQTRSFDIDRSKSLPCIDSLDEFIALCLTDFMIMTISTVVLFLILFFAVSPLALPSDPIACMCSLLFVAVLAFGVNLINAAIIKYTKIWATLLIIVTRVLLLVSGVIFVVDFLPPQIRSWININPLSHAIMWFRLGIYPNYPVHTLDRVYLVKCALGALLLGLGIERLVRYTSSTPARNDA